jgi:hypothetical protein
VTQVVPFFVCHRSTQSPKVEMIGVTSVNGPGTHGTTEQLGRSELSQAQGIFGEPLLEMRLDLLLVPDKF